MVMAQQPTQHFNLGVGAIRCHAWNKDRSQLAVSPNNNEVHIFTWRNGKWERTHVLCEHDLPITGIDWGVQTNRIVTCSQDKNAFVWTYESKSDSWKPELVLVRLNRAATCVKWSPLENKFAVGSGSKLVSVCYYERENDWWVAKQIKRPIRSTVNYIDWHPNNVLLAVASCDFKTRVFSAYIKEVDEKPGPTPWGAKMPMGQLMTEFSNGGGGWVHCVKFSPDGTRLAWVGHDSSLSVVDASDQENMSTLKDWYLPFTSIEWVTGSSIVAVGHDCCPLLFSYTGPGQLKFVSKLDVPSEQKSNQMTARKMFRNLDSKANSEADSNLKTLHQNTITEIVAHSGNKAKVDKFSTCGIDGLLVIWDLKNLQSNIPNLQVS